MYSVIYSLHSIIPCTMEIQNKRHLGGKFCFLLPKLETTNSNCKRCVMGLSRSLDSWRWRKTEMQRCGEEGWGFHLGKREVQDESGATA